VSTTVCCCAWPLPQCCEAACMMLWTLTLLPLLLLLCVPTAAATGFDHHSARTATALRSVSPHYISFALDNAFVRDPTGISGVVLPQDATNSTRIDFQDSLLDKVMPLVAGGYIRIGGTYTDFTHYYVPGSNHTRCPYAKGIFSGPSCPPAAAPCCPGNSYPCCLPLTMARWKEALEAAHRWGMQVVFNLNIMHGRFADYSRRWPASLTGPPAPPPTPASPGIPPWDSSEARALMQWTAENVPAAMWPAAFGLGNEANGYVNPETWAADNVRMHKLVVETFGKARVPHPQAARLKAIFSTLDARAEERRSSDEERGRESGIPSTYGPCNGVDPVWTGEYFGNLSAMSANGAVAPTLAAFSFHTYLLPLP
jgi:hypothetical protein